MTMMLLVVLSVVLAQAGFTLGEYPRLTAFEEVMHAAAEAEIVPERDYVDVRIEDFVTEGLSDFVPFGTHISLGDEQRTSMVVMFQAYGSLRNDSIIKFGYSSNNLEYTVHGTGKHYTQSDLCTTEASPMNGYAYTVKLVDLKPSTRYYYVVGFEGLPSGMSKSFFFTTQPSLPSDHTQFLLYGDIGGSWAGNGHRTSAMQGSLHEGSHMDFTMLIGDLSYANGKDHYWDEFLVQIENVAAYHPWQVQVGNHEYNHGECFVPFRTRFHTPNNNYDANSIFWYSFTYGPVKIVVMSTEHDFSRGSSQHNYLVREMANVDRAVTPWLIFVGHRPMYVTDYFSDLMVKNLEKELLEYKVDIAIWGHIHTYERLCAIVNYTCTSRSDQGVYVSPASPVHVVIGNAGQGKHTEFSSETNQIFADINEKFTDLTGYSRFYVNHTHFISNHVLVSTGEIFDSFTITK